jgi:hypothetical protein
VAGRGGGHEPARPTALGGGDGICDARTVAAAGGGARICDARTVAAAGGTDTAEETIGVGAVWRGASTVAG